MRQKFRNNFVSAASVTRHSPLSGDAATKIGSLSPWASCAVLISILNKKGCNRVCENRQSKFKVTIRWLTIRKGLDNLNRRVSAYLSD